MWSRIGLLCVFAARGGGGCRKRLFFACLAASLVSVPSMLMPVASPSPTETTESVCRCCQMFAGGTVTLLRSTTQILTPAGCELCAVSRSHGPSQQPQIKLAKEMAREAAPTRPACAHMPNLPLRPRHVAVGGVRAVLRVRRKPGAGDWAPSLQMVRTAITLDSADTSVQAPCYAAEITRGTFSKELPWAGGRDVGVALWAGGQRRDPGPRTEPPRTPITSDLPAPPKAPSHVKFRGARPQIS